MTEARDRLTRLPEEFAGDPETDAIAITRRGRPVLAVLPWDLYESIRETLEIMGDPELMSALRESIEQVASEKTVPWEDVKDLLSL
jgi:PHD/YefM family antitoxin component YafN of YafNO toxin-antitoxin module